MLNNMFQISSYLQYRNTPDGKPRVLREGVDYKIKDINFLYESEHDYNRGLGIANLSDCRGLLSTNKQLHDEPELFFQELVVVGSAYHQDGLITFGSWDNITEAQFIYNECTWEEDTNKPGYFDKSKEKIIKWQWVDFSSLGEKYWFEGYFPDDPKKYSQLLWGCGEEEGWEKVLELLNVKL